MEIKIENLGKVAMTVEKEFYSPDKCYDKLTLVQDKNLGTYISRKPVPANKELTDRNYWIPIIVGSGSNNDDNNNNNTEPAQAEFKGLIEGKWGTYGEGYGQALGVMTQKWVTNNYRVFDDVDLSFDDRLDFYDVTEPDSIGYIIDELYEVYDIIQDEFYNLFGNVGSPLDMEVRFAIDNIIENGIPLNNLQSIRLPYCTIGHNYNFNPVVVEEVNVGGYNTHAMVIHECKGEAWSIFTNWLGVMAAVFDIMENGGNGGYNGGDNGDDNGGGIVVKTTSNSLKSKKITKKPSAIPGIYTSVEEALESFNNVFNNIKAKSNTKKGNTTKVTTEPSPSPSSGVVNEQYIQSCIDVMTNDMQHLGDYVELDGSMMYFTITDWLMIMEHISDLIINFIIHGINSTSNPNDVISYLSTFDPEEFEHEDISDNPMLDSFMFMINSLTDWDLLRENITDLTFTTSEIVKLQNDLNIDKYHKILEQVNNMIVWPTDDLNNPIDDAILTFYKKDGKYYMLWHVEGHNLKLSRIGNVVPSGVYDDNSDDDNDDNGGGRNTTRQLSK